MALLEAIIGFIMVGITMEVFWTSILNYIRTKKSKLTGKTYLWMFPIYAVVPFLYIFIIAQFGKINIFIRGIIYVIGFYSLEFGSGYLIRKMVGVSPWNYRYHSIKISGKKYRTNLKGLICLEHAPVWYIYGIIGEFYFKFLMSI